MPIGFWDDTSDTWDNASDTWDSTGGGVGTAAPVVTIASLYDPITGYPEIQISVTDVQAGETPIVVIVRSDGLFLVGASPQDGTPITDGQTIVFTDTTAPYGQIAMYRVNLVYSNVYSTPVNVSALMGQAFDTTRLWDFLPQFAKDNDTALGLPFQKWLGGIGSQQQIIDNLVRDTGSTPGWSQIMDVDICPTFALPWLGQLVGVRLPQTGVPDAQMRYLIRNTPGFLRGTPQALQAAANQYLINGYTATIIERDTSPYHLTIDIPSAGVAGAATCGALALAYASCSAVESAFGTCFDLWQADDQIIASVESAIPAGLIATINFV